MAAGAVAAEVGDGVALLLLATSSRPASPPMAGALLLPATIATSPICVLTPPATECRSNSAKTDISAKGIAA